MPPAENNETPKYDLPPPIMENGEKDNADQSEKPVSSPEVAKSVTGPKVSRPKTSLSDFGLNDSTPPPEQTVVSATSNSSNPQVADDDDLIEKEWVAKAKKIIEDNREDPYNQSKEITSFKSDYMKKRYNKIVKAGE